MVCLVWQVCFGRFDLVWYGLFYEEDLKKPLVPLKVAKASLELHLETIPVRVCPGRVGPIVILRLTQSSWAGAGTELGNISNPKNNFVPKNRVTNFGSTKF